MLQAIGTVPSAMLIPAVSWTATLPSAGTKAAAMLTPAGRAVAGVTVTVSALRSTSPARAGTRLARVRRDGLQGRDRRQLSPRR